MTQAIIVFIWYLLSTPSDRLVCSMWISNPPSRADMAAAGCNWTTQQAPGYVLRGIRISDGQIMCERPASELPRLTCDLWPLDHYLLRVYEPGYQDQLCALSIMHDGPPSAEDITAQCTKPLPSSYLVKLIMSGPYLPPTPPAPICPMPKLDPTDLPSSPAALATSNHYDLLAYHLRWYYGSDIEMDTWQNQFDPEIYKAGLSLRVPPRILKAIFAQESQFWPTHNKTIDKTTNEIGIGQLTDDGADLVIRYTPALYAQYCPMATLTSRCSHGYDLLTDNERQMIRDIFRRSLITDAWWPHQAAEQAKAQMTTWAQVLVAYYCAAGEIVRPAGDQPSWDYALAAYHAGPECIRGGFICLEGQEYIQQVRNQ